MSEAGRDSSLTSWGAHLVAVGLRAAGPAVLAQEDPKHLIREIDALHVCLRDVEAERDAARAALIEATDALQDAIAARDEARGRLVELRGRIRWAIEALQP
jgi:hypothetical protein